MALKRTPLRWYDDDEYLNPYPKPLTTIDPVILHHHSMGYESSYESQLVHPKGTKRRPPPGVTVGRLSTFDDDF